MFNTVNFELLERIEEKIKKAKNKSNFKYTLRVKRSYCDKEEIFYINDISLLNTYLYILNKTKMNYDLTAKNF